MLWKTGEEQLLLLTAPTLRQRKTRIWFRSVLQCSDGGTTPGCDATCSLQARRQTRRRATANCRHGTDHTANIVAICTKPAKTQERGLHERQRGSRAFLCGGKPVAQKEREHVGNGARRRQRAATSTIIGCFFFFCQRKHISLFFFLPTTHEVGTASAAQVDCTHDVSLLLGAEVSDAHPKRVGEREAFALRTNPSGHGLRP